MLNTVENFELKVKLWAMEGIASSFLINGEDVPNITDKERDTLAEISTDLYSEIMNYKDTSDDASRIFRALLDDILSEYKSEAQK